MSRKKISLSVSAGLTITIVIIIAIIGLSYRNNSTKPSTAASSNLSTVVIATPIVTTVTQTQASTPNITPTDTPVQVGQVYDRPYNKEGIQVVRVADIPSISQDVALQALIARIGFNPMKNSTNVVLSATFGAVTQGQREADGSWSGARNLPIVNCTVTGQCTPTGQYLDHLENRLMWVLDFANVSVPLPGVCNATQTCKAPPNATHIVYLIDAQTLQIHLAIPYST